MVNKKLHFLIVEDNEYNRLVLIDTIKDLNSTIKLDVAENGKMGFEMAERTVYDIIFMDLQMPIMNGIEATKKIKSLPQPHCNSPIIAVTANTLIDDQNNCKKAGMSNFLSKPFTIESLTKCITEELGFNPATLQPNKAGVDIKTGKMVKIKSLIDITGGNKDRMKQIINLFLKTINNELTTIQNAINDKDYIKVKKTLHGIKPKYTYVGLPQLSEITKQIEQNVSNEDDLTKTLELTNTLIKQTELACIELKDIVEN